MPFCVAVGNFRFGQQQSDGHMAKLLGHPGRGEAIALAVGVPCSISIQQMGCC